MSADMRAPPSPRYRRRAGLTERTFFRHFSDKREVLFGGADALQELLVGRLDEAADSLTPMAAVAETLLEVLPVVFEERRAFACRRQAIIVANKDLQERELIKLAWLVVALADALRRRGVGEPAASLAAEAGIAVFRVSFERWVDDDDEMHPLAEHIGDSLAELAELTVGGGGSTGRRARRGLHRG